MTDAEKLKLIENIVSTGFMGEDFADRKSFLHGILCAIDDVIGYGEPEQKENPASEDAGSVKL